MRLPSVSGDNSGMASVTMVAIAATLVKSMARNFVSCSFRMRKSSMRPAQKSKLIIFFMTKMPMLIQIAQPTIIMRPVSVVQSSSMYCGLVR